jgi:molecular chaperone GrpE
MEEIIVNGRYRHYKGSIYRVLAVALNSESKAREVVYESEADGRVWVRSEKMFLESVVNDEDGSKKPRFEFIDQEESDKSKYLRALADYQNLLKQSARDKEDFFRFALSDVISDFLPVYDHLKLSVKSLSEDEVKSPWVEGVRHVIKQFSDVLSQHGVEEIRAEGQQFDLETMEAISGEGDMVRSEISTGYKLNGRLIRPAKVIVG